MRSVSSSNWGRRPFGPFGPFGPFAAMVAMALAATLIGGCGHIGVKAHQRELLADRTMKLEGNPQERAADEHIIANREGAIGGTGTSGGGCGCN